MLKEVEVPQPLGLGVVNLFAQQARLFILPQPGTSRVFGLANDKVTIVVAKFGDRVEAESSQIPDSCIDHSAVSMC
jgi:hypothetical protein